MAYKYKMLKSSDISAKYSGTLKPDVRQRRDSGKVRKKK